MSQHLVLLSGLGFQASVFDSLRTHLPQDLTIHTAPIEEPAHYLGWSLGGLQALDLAAHHPDRVASILMVATSPRLRATENWPGVEPKYWQPFEDLSDEGRKKAMKILLRLQGDRDCMRTIRDHLLPVESPEWELGVCALRDLDLRETCKALTPPVAAVFGSADALLPAAVAETLRSIAPVINVQTIEGGPHALPFTHAEEIARIWREFAYAPSH